MILYTIITLLNTFNRTKKSKNRGSAREIASLYLLLKATRLIILVLSCIDRKTLFWYCIHWRNTTDPKKIQFEKIDDRSPGFKV